MAALEALRHALAAAGYAPLEPHPEGFAWLGAKDHWGSVAAVGLVAVDGLGPEALEARVAGLHAAAQGLAPMAGQLVIRPALGRPSAVDLGVYAVALAVFERGAAPEAVRALRAQRPGGMRSRVHTYGWAVDAPLRRCWEHRGLPFAVPPGRRWVERALGGPAGP